ncbi:hypothetical protein COW99_04810 [Candidatus Roizmanbacteria bacterium CG22_combo_CG10-13_8_21_14_all_38_20]|uniref:AB hydrolase-1 domain-containing protein n=1 Tax=Candidatus Roizmanbacteria bacterium CG22_combo_CG10-13_8_21_14_all_38_20 TaxID=1974862 RepID=A0A2H0BUD6_9BACT|nr:hypothetical protein [Candidatus Microgenomates bacterium]PIP61306.1 MAG: hypothetical protein COW99_04810 [Candidatus Roizmanbacteria bacterium CG22_combo_CG10-13_8_21_14_all_38_20]PJC30622.1 MAG: hypothetical protein CO050_05935 [Candidatus Roizmanbacteria bacterium CG_4_9_14_0_2_um_filter_38_17]
MSKEHKVLVIPGLGDQRVKPIEWAVSHWRNYGLEPIVHAVGWHDGEDSFEPKLNRLTDMIDQLTEAGDTVSLVGTSAGGSAAINAFIERREIVHRVINVCGRLRVGPTTGFRSFSSKSKSSSAFAQSVRLCEAHENLLSETDKQKIMTVRVLFGDELVPPETTVIQGAYNIIIPTAEHVLSIASALTVFSKPLIIFLKQDDSKMEW